MTDVSESKVLVEFIKRLLDITLSLLGLILLSPMFVIIGVWIKRDSSGPVFFMGSRTARAGEIFYILKFRTMYDSPDSFQGPKVTAQDDPRITRLGHWLRDTKLNELPQLWNVLKGEMSLVGPRPEDPDIVATWPEDVRREILSVRPGITSPATVLYRNEETMLRSGQAMQTYIASILPSKLRLDQLYVRHRSLWLDLDVLLWTVLVLLTHPGSYKPPEEKLFWGPVSRLSRRYLNWLLIDTVTTFVAFGLVGVIWRSMRVLNVGWPKAAWIASGFALLFSLTGAIWGLNRIVWSKALAEDIFDLVPAGLVATLVVFAVNYISGIFPSIMILTSCTIAFFGFVSVRYRSRLFSGLASRLLRFRPSAKAVGERVLIVGGGDAGQFVVWMINNSRRTKAFYVVGFIDDDLYKQGVRIRGVNVIGRSRDIPDIVAQHDIGIIVFAIHNISFEERQKLLGICHMTPARVVMLPDFLGALDKILMLNKDDSGTSTFVEISDKESESENSKIPVHQVDAWLEELHRITQKGDIKEIQSHVRYLQNLIRDDFEVDHHHDRYYSAVSNEELMNSNRG